jgi:hypothetical protein
MKTIYRLIVIALFSVLASRSEAQKAPIDTDMLLLASGSKVNFNATAQYMSNLTYAGRRDESSVPVLLPGFTAVYKRGLFISASGYFDLNGTKSGSEGLSITPGYLFSLDTAKKFGGSVMVTKYFITNSSPIILSSFNASVDGQLYYNGPVKLTLGATFSLDKDNNRDLINNVQLEKEVWLYKTGPMKASGLKITPAVTFYGGSQAFTETYYADSQVPRAVADPAILSPINTLFPGLTQQQILNKTITQQKEREVKQYKLLAISGSIPIDYALNNWQFTLTPYLTHPFNQVDYTGNGTSGNYFFFTAGVSYVF